MTTTHQHAITATLGLAAIVALVAFAVHAQNPAGVDVPCEANTACAASPADARSGAAPTRRAARVHLTMPYFSYARALPRTTEL